MLAEKLCKSIVEVSESIKSAKKAIEEERESGSVEKEKLILQRLTDACEALEREMGKGDGRDT